MQQRVVMSFMGFLSVAVSYSMRACLSVAITEMTETIVNPNQGNRSMVCDVHYSQMSHNNNKAHSVSVYVRNKCMDRLNFFNQITENVYAAISSYNLSFIRMVCDIIGPKRSRDIFYHHFT